MKLYTDTINIFKELEPIQFIRQSFPEREIGSGGKEHHMHPFFELYFLLDGEVEFFVENKKQMLQAESGKFCAVALTFAGEIHNAIVSRKNYDHSCFFFTENSFPQFDNKKSPLDCFTGRERGEKNFFIPRREAFKRIIELIDRLTELSRSESSFRVFAEWSAALELITLAGSEWEYAFDESDKSEPKLEPTVNPIATRAASYISENFRSIDSLASVAAYCGVTQSYLSRVFRDELGIKPNEYLRRRRLEYAKTLLLNGYDVTSACYNSGFCDYSHFIQVFRAAEGTTPLSFQKNNRVLRNDSTEPN